MSYSWGGNLSIELWIKTEDGKKLSSFAKATARFVPHQQAENLKWECERRLEPFRGVEQLTFW